MATDVPDLRTSPHDRGYPPKIDQVAPGMLGLRQRAPIRTPEEQDLEPRDPGCRPEVF